MMKPSPTIAHVSEKISPNYEEKKFNFKKGKETEKSLILYLYLHISNLKPKYFFSNSLFFFSKKKCLMSIYMAIYFRTKIAMQERGAEIIFLFFFAFIPKLYFASFVKVVCVWRAQQIFLQCTYMHISIVPKKIVFAQQKNNIKSNVPAIIICEKNILKINENELHYTRAAVCITQKKWKHFFSPHEIKSTIAKILPKIIW